MKEFSRCALDTGKTQSFTNLKESKLLLIANPHLTKGTSITALTTDCFFIFSSAGI